MVYFKKVKEGIEMKDKVKFKKIHIAVIIVGIIFILLSAFHSNIWFDEAYSVGMAERTFTEIWNIGGHDVHPVLYYWMLRILSLALSAWGLTSIAGKIMLYRIFSIVPIAILGILGYTHIKKDFGEKTGIIFSFLTFFLPECVIYANEIRMYSWSILAVTVLAIYAYRLRLPENSTRKNWLIFFFASISSIFLHYYGLMAAGLINVVLLIYLIIHKRGKDIIAICTFGFIQLIAYIPWLMYLASQLTNVSKGYWIKFTFPNTIFELLAGQIIGNQNYNVGFVIAICLYVYLGIIFYKYKENKTPAKLSIGIYLAVVVAAVVMTKILHTDIIYYRYLFVITGLYIFTISFILSKEKNNKIIWVVCAIIATMGTATNIKMIKDGYSKNNFKQYEYLKENIQKDDSIVFKEIDNGSTISIFFPENEKYFYNPENWNVEEAYKAFGNQMKTYINTDFIKELDGRIWIIDTLDKSLYNELFNNEEYKVLNEKEFITKYHNYSLNIMLIEKIKE